MHVFLTAVYLARLLCSIAEGEVWKEKKKGGDKGGGLEDEGVPFLLKISSSAGGGALGVQRLM